MTPLPFVKLETIGNHFVLLQGAHLTRPAASYALPLCASRFGIGAEGLLIFHPHPEGFALEFYNPDGTVDFCGNGLRSAAAWAVLEGHAPPQGLIHQRGRAVPYRVEDGLAIVTMPAGSFDPADVPLARPEPVMEQPIVGVTGTAISTGSTHFVVFVPALPDDPEFLAVSPRIEHDPAFPERTSVMWANIMSPAELRLRIWERGVGETLGCGTGSLAAAKVYVEREARAGRPVPAQVTVHNPGGTLRVSFAPDRQTAEMSSRPRIVFRGDWSE